MLIAIVTGFVCGFIGSMPVAGPIAILVVGRGIENRSRSGLYLATGAAVAESVYAGLAFWGFSAFLSRYTWLVPVTRAIAAIVLIGIGLRLSLRAPPKETQTPPNPRVGNKRSFLLGFTITALNPTLIASWTTAVSMVFASGLVPFEEGGALPFSVGAFIGIVAWFATLLALLGRVRKRFTGPGLHRLLRFLGWVLVVVGLWIGGVVVRGLL